MFIIYFITNYVKLFPYFVIIKPIISTSDENISIIFKNIKNNPIITKQKTITAKKNTILNAVSIDFIKFLFIRVKFD